jgi:PAS domain-containing protein
MVDDKDQQFDALTYGERLMTLGLDKKVSGGFWVFDEANWLEFYSPNYRSCLGYESEKDFPSTPESWRNQIFEDDLIIAIDNLEKHKEDTSYPYYQRVRYRKKDNSIVNLICAGTIVRQDEGKVLMLGTHELLI